MLSSSPRRVRTPSQRSPASRFPTAVSRLPCFSRSSEMGFVKEEKLRSRMWRSVKTVFFLITMLISFLIFSAPVLLAIADAVLPVSLLSVSLSPYRLTFASLPSYFSSYDFRTSLIDIPILSIIRSAIILCVYGICDGPSLCRGPYLGITTACSVLSSLFVLVKACFVVGEYKADDGARFTVAEVAIFVISLGLAAGHVVAAYRRSSKERRKLLIYKIDIEAVSAAKIGLPKRYKLLLEERQK